jgi:hypothetical protein
MDTNTLNSLYLLDDEAKEVLKNLRQVMDKAQKLGAPLADDADGLYMRLRVVLGAIGDHAVANDDNRQE